jgi:uncharacterized protein (DUF1697 family)
MPALREALSAAGFKNVRTYVQSGNVVLDARLQPGSLERRLEQLLAEQFELTIPVIVRSRDELAQVVERNRLGDVAQDPKRYQVCFLRSELKPEVVEQLGQAAIPPEQVVVDDREIYSWHDAGIARSKLWAAVASKKLGVDGTARNWTTVTTLLQMADE